MDHSQSKCYNRLYMTGKREKERETERERERKREKERESCIIDLYVLYVNVSYFCLIVI